MSIVFQNGDTAFHYAVNCPRYVNEKESPIHRLMDFNVISTIKNNVSICSD